MTNDEKFRSQLDREDASESAGYDRFMKAEDNNNKINNGSSNSFGLSMMKARHEQVILCIEAGIKRNVGTKVKQIRETLSLCTKLDTNGKAHKLMNIDVWAYLGFQAVMDNLFNPNLIETKILGKYGGEKKLAAKKDQTELELHVGKLINDQMSLQLIKEVFPEWFRVSDKFAKRTKEGGVRATPAYWNKRMTRSINKFIQRLHDEGDHDGAEFLDNRRPWTKDDCRVIGELVVGAVLEANSDYIQSEWEYDNGKKIYNIILTKKGIEAADDIKEKVAKYSHDVLPMLVEPNIVTNESLGGWYKEILQEQPWSPKGEIILSDRHLEFINRQAQVKFELNPFTHELIKRLMEEGKPLGKFDYQVPEKPNDVATHLGVAAVNDPTTKQHLIDSSDRDAVRQARRAVNNEMEDNIIRSMHNVISARLVSMSDQLAQDEYFYIPMKYDFRGRIYSRVPFLSFQGTDAGKYLLRFHEKTPIDDRTAHWLKVGISNAAGNDKKCWDGRIKWFDDNFEEIVNVGQMLTTGDFYRAYEFLTQDTIDDPFCLAALANEYVKVFIEQTQTYTQVFVTVDASCSGTSIFNAWRLNRTGALKTNLIKTDKPADIYMAVWEKIKENAPLRAFRKSFIKRLEKSKLLRKMMKSTYVPASYASPEGEQKMKLSKFNKSVLAKADLAFKDAEIKILQDLWSDALDAVSGINSVVKWFRSRTKEAIQQGAKEILVTSSNGSQMILKYPKSDLKRIPVLGNADCTSRRKSLREFKDEPHVQKLLNSVTANVTHMTDAAALCEALWDWEVSFVAIHDAVGLAPSQRLDEGVERLKRGLITATQHNVWDSFRKDNNLPLSSVTAGPVVGDLDLEEIMDSNYMFS